LRERAARIVERSIRDHGEFRGYDCQFLDPRAFFAQELQPPSLRELAAGRVLSDASSVRDPEVLQRRITPLPREVRDYLLSGKRCSVCGRWRCGPTLFFR